MGKVVPSNKTFKDPTLQLYMIYLTAQCVPLVRFLFC